MSEEANYPWTCPHCGREHYCCDACKKAYAKSSKSSTRKAREEAVKGNLRAGLLERHIKEAMDGLAMVMTSPGIEPSRVEVRNRLEDFTMALLDLVAAADSKVLQAVDIRIDEAIKRSIMQFTGDANRGKGKSEDKISGT